MLIHSIYQLQTLTYDNEPMEFKWMMTFFILRNQEFSLNHVSMKLISKLLFVDEY